MENSKLTEILGDTRDINYGTNYVPKSIISRQKNLEQFNSYREYLDLV